METCQLIHLKKNGGDGTSFSLTRESTLILGRDPECDFRVQVPSVSNKHAKLTVDKSGKVYVSSLVSNAPVKLDDVDVTNDRMLISHLGIMKVGSCSFRFEYLKSSVSPLQEANGTLAAGKVQSKSPRTPKQIGKENSSLKRASSGEVLTPLTSASRKITPKVVLNMSPSTTPSRRKSRSKDGTTPTAPSLPATPVSAVSKREKVPTPIPSRNSLYRRSSRKSSLASIQEVDEPANLTRKRSLSKTDTSLLSGSLLNASVDNELPRKRSRKSVTFGPMLSPEFFDKRFPPSTPVKAGSGPSGKRRSVLSTSVLSEAIDEVSEEDLTDSSDDEYEYSLTGFEDSFLDGSNDEKNSPTEDEYFIAEEDPPPKRKLATPTKIEIECRPPLHKMQPALPSPVRQTFSSHPILTQTKRVVSSPLLNQARNSRLSLGKAKIGMSTPIRRDIEKRPSLRKTKKSMPTPVRKAIEDKPSLRKTKKSMPTPVRKAIEDKPSLRKTKKSMPTPVRKAIEDKPSLRKTKKSMPVLLRKAIESNPTLRKTLKSMATPIRREIEAKPSLRKTRQSMPSPLLAEIRTRYSLRAAIKRSLPTPIRKTIESQPALRKTKRTMPTPLRVEIQGRPKLCKTKKSLPSTLRLAIEAKHTLRKTKRTLPTPIRDAIKQRPGLRTTKPSLPSSLATEIESRPALRVTKKKLPTPLRAQIKSGVALNTTKKSLPTPVRGEIQGRPKLSHVPLRPVKRAVGESSSCDSPVPLPPSKKRRVATSSPPYKRLRPAKRAVGESLSSCDSPVPLPPAKRRRVAPSSPSPYKFDAFLKHGVSSPDLAGMRSIFNSPKVKFSAEPSDMFEPRLFGGALTGISFASPLAYSAKKPNGPQRTVPMASRLKNKSESIRFEIGSSEPLSTARNGKKRVGRAKATARAPHKVTKSTRNSQVQLGEEVTVTLATRRSKRGTALKEAAPAVPLSGFTTGPSMATRRSRRGKEAVSIEDNPMVTPMATRRSRRGKEEVAAISIDIEDAPMATRRSRRGKEEEAAAISIEDTPMATRRSKRGTAAKKEAAGVSVDDTPMVTPLVTRRSRRGTDKEETANGKTKKTKVEEVLSTPISVRSNAAGSRRGKKTKKTRGTVASEAVEVEVQSPRIHVTRSRKTTEKAEEKPAQQDAGVVGSVRRSHRLQKQ